MWIGSQRRLQQNTRREELSPFPKRGLQPPTGAAYQLFFLAWLHFWHKPISDFAKAARFAWEILFETNQNTQEVKNGRFLNVAKTKQCANFRHTLPLTNPRQADRQILLLLNTQKRLNTAQCYCWRSWWNASSFAKYFQNRSSRRRKHFNSIFNSDI